MTYHLFGTFETVLIFRTDVKIGGHPLQWTFADQCFQNHYDETLRTLRYYRNFCAINDNVRNELNQIINKFIR